MPTKAELKALEGLPHLPRLLYHEGIRPRMDYQTGYVGATPGHGICWQGLRESLEIEKAPGITYWAPTVKMLRRASEHLEKRGLIKNCTLGKRLIFFCLLATSDQSVQKKVGSKWAEQSLREPGVFTNRSANSGHTSVYMSDCVYSAGSESDSEPDWLIHFRFFQKQNIFTAQELDEHINDYVQYCTVRHKQPSLSGCRALLNCRWMFKTERSRNQAAFATLNESRRMKLRAKAKQQEDEADRIHSDNIHRRQHPFTTG